jgi:hypothetical protein
MSRRQLCRRKFLEAIGIGAALSPFVPYLNRDAEAASQAFPKRLVLTFAPNGTVESKFWPQGGEADFSFAKGQITEPLAPYRSKLIFPKNLTRPKPHGGGPHEVAMGSLWTACSLLPDQAGGYGFAAGPSIDQILVGKLRNETAFASLALSVAHDEQIGGDLDATTKYMIYSGSGRPVLPDPDPYHAFGSLLLSGGGNGSVTPDALARVRAERKSVLDLVLSELDALDKKIGAEDRDKVESHITGLRDIEKRLEAPVPTAGAPEQCTPGRPATGYERKLYDNDSFPALLKMQTDLLVAALACDATRIASVQWSRTFSMLRHTWLDANAPQHHTNSHLTSDEAVTWQYRMSYWYAQQLAYVLERMNAVTEGDGTLLDHSLVVWGYDMSYGAVHDISPTVAVLAGSLGGAIDTGENGRLLDFESKYDWTQLLVTICQAMGASDVNVVGDLGRAGTLPGLLKP